MTWPYVAVLAWYFWQRRDQLNEQHRCLVNTHLLIAFFYLAMFTLGNRFMLERYAGIFTLFMMPYLCFAMAGLWQSGPRSRGRIIALILLLAMAGDSLHNNNYKKAFVREASDWILENTADDALLLSNNRRLIYFSERPYEWRRGKPVNDRFPVSALLERPAMRCGYDYLAIEVRPRDEDYWAAFLRRVSQEEYRVFDGGRHGRIVIVDQRGRRDADARCQRQ